jgi:hypothetical protein
MSDHPNVSNGWKADIDERNASNHLALGGYAMFWGLNVGLGALTLLGMKNSVAATISLGLATALLVGWAATGIANRPRYHSVLGPNWVEREIGVYASIIFWAAILCAAVDPEFIQLEPTFTVFPTVVYASMAGMLVSLVPLSRLLKIRG